MGDFKQSNVCVTGVFKGIKEEHISRNNSRNTFEFDRNHEGKRTC